MAKHNGNDGKSARRTPRNGRLPGGAARRNISLSREADACLAEVARRNGRSVSAQVAFMAEREWERGEKQKS